MSEPYLVTAEDIPSIPSPEDEAYLHAAAQNGTAPAEPRPWNSESWATFRDASQEEPRWLISGLMPEGQLVFTAAPPKKGKTWIAIAKAVSLATGRPLFGEYEIPEPVQTLYVALEGSRPAMRARIGCICRGLGVDPDRDIPFLRMLYRPRPFDLASDKDAAWLEEEVYATGARYVVIDVLRAAARIKETDEREFGDLRYRLQPVLDSGVTIDLLHHFGKLNDTQKDRTPGERMSGTGAMYGALDVGFYITRSESGARRLRVELEARDFATPDAIGVVIEGTGSGEHGGFRYTDTANFVLDAAAAEDRDLVAEIEQLFSDGVWRTVSEVAGKDGVGSDPSAVRATLSDSPERFCMVTGELALEAGRKSKSAKAWGTVRMHHEVISALKSPKSPDLFEDASPRGDAGGVPYGDTPTDTTSSTTVEGDSLHPNHLDEEEGYF